MKQSRRILSIVIVFFWASEYAHVPYFAPYLKYLGFSASMIGIMTGTYGFTQTFVRIPLGMTTDLTSGYRAVVIMGTVFTTLSSFFLIFAKSAWFIIFCRFLAGVAASTWLAFSVLYSAYFDPSEGVTAMTNINVFNNVGKLIAFALGTIVATTWGYRYPLIVSFLTGVIAIILALQLKSIPIKNEPMKISSLLITFKNPCVLIPTAFAIILQMILQGTTFSFTSSVAELLGATRFQIGLNTALYTIVQVAAGNWLRKHITEKIHSADFSSDGISYPYRTARPQIYCHGTFSVALRNWHDCRANSDGQYGRPYELFYFLPDLWRYCYCRNADVTGDDTMDGTPDFKDITKRIFNKTG